MTKTPYKEIIKYYWNAKTKYSLHSPFMFDFYQNIMAPTVDDPAVAAIEVRRNNMLSSKESINFIEMGAGSKLKSGSQRNVRDVAKSSLSGPWQCEILHKLIKHYNHKNILEIGTSLGISTAYLASANNEAKVTTLEGNPSSIDIANQNFNALQLSNITVKEGNFDETLPSVLSDLGRVDMAFIDGNHRKKATVDYFELILNSTGTQSVVIVDDIYWSQGMHDAWKIIIANENVAFSIDMFHMGLVFFDHSVMPKLNFPVINSRYKPFSIGLFG